MWPVLSPWVRMTSPGPNWRMGWSLRAEKRKSIIGGSFGLFGYHRGHREAQRFYGEAFLALFIGGVLRCGLWRTERELPLLHCNT
jgi:hypothetical protein